MILLGSLLVLAACGGDQEVITQPRDGDQDPPPSPGGGPGGLVISVERGGGFVPAGTDFRTPPLASIYEDGTAISPAATTAIYPGPAVAPLVEGSLAEGQIDASVAAADDAGLLEPGTPDFGQPPVADAATTTLRVVAGGEEHVVAVYALDIGGSLGEPLPGVTAEQREARQRVAEVVELVTSAATRAGENPWVPDRYRVLPLAPAGADPAVPPGEQAWPLPDVELVEGECVAVTGEAAERLRAALEQASEITRWTTSSGAVFNLAVRAVLPHEPGCPA